MAIKKSLTREQALQKLKHYCAYQERCHREVREKLFDLGVWKREHDEIISCLIEEDYLNEERFAIAFAGGKFRIKKWGRVRIRHALKQKDVSDYCIRKGLAQIPDEDYENTARTLAVDKYAALKGEQYLIRKKKTLDYLISRGFEPELGNALIRELSKKE